MLMWGIMAGLPAITGVLACIGAASLMLAQRSLLESYRRIAASRHVLSLPQRPEYQLQWRIRCKHNTDVLASRMRSLLAELRGHSVRVEAQLHVDGTWSPLRWKLEGPAVAVGEDLFECVSRCAVRGDPGWISHFLSEPLGYAYHSAGDRDTYASLEVTCWVIRIPRVVLQQVEVLPPELAGLQPHELSKLRDLVRAEAEVRKLTG